jgi:hypothetical protein
MGQYLEGSGLGLVEVFSQHLPGGFEKNNRNPQCGLLLSWRMFESSVSRK